MAWPFLVEIIGASLGVSHWLARPAGPCITSPAQPADTVRWDSAAILIATGVAAAIAGALAFARRDLRGA